MLPMMAILPGGRNRASANIPSGTIEDSDAYPSGAEASLTFESDGALTIVGSGISAPRWLIGSTAGSGYELRVSAIVGSFSAGSEAFNTTLALSSDRVFKVTRSSFGTKSCEASYSIYAAGGYAAGASPLTTGEITLTATVA